MQDTIMNNAQGESIISELVGIKNALGAKAYLQNKSVTLSDQQQVISHDRGYLALGNVTVPGINLQQKVVTPTKSPQVILPDSGYDGMSEVDVHAIPDEYADVSQTTAEAEDVAEGKVFVSANGTITIGTATGGGGGSGLVIMSYGKSTWAEFLAAYRANEIVYCRASSSSDPATGSQVRMAFMAYVNNETNPTQVEFQYYRSVSSHTDAQQGDQVFVYLLNSNNTWSVTTRNAFTKIAAGTGLKSSYSGGVLTLSLA